MADIGPSPGSDGARERGRAPVIDLREDPPVRRRQMRGVPREADLLLLSYRDAPAEPLANRSAALRLGLAGGVDLERRPESHLAVSEPTETVETLEPGRPLAGDLVVRRLRLRSVAKVTFTFALCMLAVVLVAGIVLWTVADRAGWVTQWTSLLVDLGFTDATVDGPTILRASSLAGVIVAATATLLTLAAAIIYNQISGLVGGFEFSVRSRRAGRRSAAID